MLKCIEGYIDILYGNPNEPVIFYLIKIKV